MMEEKEIKNVLVTDIATDTSGNETIGNLANRPTDKSIVLVELVHMLYNCAVILDKLSTEDKDKDSIQDDSKTILLLGDRYMIKLKEILNTCETGNFSNKKSVENLIDDDEVKKLVDKLSIEIKDDIRKEDN